MDTINKNWIAANRSAGFSDHPSQKLLARLRSDPANQVIINQDSENEDDGSIEAGSRATQHDRDNVRFTEEQQDSTNVATAGACIKDGALSSPEISVQCMQFITAIENQEYHISPRRAEFSACLKTFIGRIQQWQPIPAASRISGDVMLLLHNAYRYGTAVQELKQLEADYTAWWLKKRPGGRTASQIREALISGNLLQLQMGDNPDEAMPQLQSNEDPIAIAPCVQPHPLEEIRGHNEDLQSQSVNQLDNTLETITKSLSAHIQGEKVEQPLPAWELLQKATRVNTYYCVSVRNALAEAAEMQTKIIEEIQESGRYYGGFRARAMQAQIRLVRKEVAKLPDVGKYWDVLQQMRPLIEEPFTERVLAALKARITFFQGPLVKQRQSPIYQSMESRYTSELNKLNKLKDFGDLTLQFYMDLVIFTYITMKDVG
ncbi:uncharacterized protein AB675_10400 [Cyphellophora attinorum]|uniref:Uncharacterized protein n=1 Tax=Cyphellophora attinorum TaxID=1664694 RepID=A0A0N0NJT8_9EURO|nr:uncharacterized protein AB675_10400 [Phialophora attinorum]KPI37361.1 hypothetical protein AB675_10400 [Phialophora attinorum]